MGSDQIGRDGSGAAIVRTCGVEVNGEWNDCLCCVLTCLENAKDKYVLEADSVAIWHFIHTFLFTMINMSIGQFGAPRRGMSRSVSSRLLSGTNLNWFVLR
jgi:hypothetical protein